MNWRYTLKKLLVICLALTLLASTGCADQPQNEANETVKKTTTTIPSKEIVRKDTEGMVHKDPVDGSIIENIEKAKYTYIFEGIRFYFNSKETLEAFKKDPRKYLLELPKLDATRKR